MRQKEEELILKIDHINHSNTKNTELEKYQGYCIDLLKKINGDQGDVDRAGQEISQNQKKYMEIKQELESLDDAIKAYKIEYNEKNKEYERIIKISSELTILEEKLKEKKKEISLLLKEKATLNQEKQQPIINAEVSREYDDKILDVRKTDIYRLRLN